MTKYAVLGTGTVGQTLTRRLIGLGHEVVMGSRTSGSRDFDWTVATFADATVGADLVVNATGGAVSLAVLRAAGDLAGKVIVDLSNPIDPDSGFPPSLTVANTDSLGEQIQAAFPQSLVVKTLNTINCDVMVEPSRVPGEHVVFVAGADAGAKATVTAMLEEFGWPGHRVLDLGGIEAARATEMYLPLWIRLNGVVGGHTFNIALARG